MRDITDFSAKDSKAYKESVSLYEEAFGAADSDLLSFDEARRDSSEIPTTFTRKTHNSIYFLDEDKISHRKMNEKTNAVAELLEANKSQLQETLMYGADPEELEKEVRGDLGREILEVLKEHNVTGKAIWDAIDILRAILGDDPSVNDAIESWGGSSENTDSEDTSSDEEDNSSGEDTVEESVENFPKTIEEMSKILKHKIAEKKLRERAGLRRHLKEMELFTGFGIGFKRNNGKFTLIDTKGNQANGKAPIADFETKEEAKKSDVFKKASKNYENVVVVTKQDIEKYGVN